MRPFLKQIQSGRSILETLGVLAVLALVTVAGLRGFGYLSVGATADSVTKAVFDRALDRQHGLMGRDWRVPESEDAVTTMGPHGVSITVKNGTDGALKNLFWVELGTTESPLNVKLCNELLKNRDRLSSGGLQLVHTTVNNTIAESCQTDAIVSFFFFKNAKSSHNALAGNIRVTPQVVDEGGTPTDCPAISCPAHATCTGNTVTCIAGYTKTGCNTCNPSCQACTGNTYQPNNTASCETECTACTVAERAINNHTACECLPRGEACPDNAGYSSGASDNCTCDECTENSHCSQGYICNASGTCVPEMAGGTESCPDGQMADGNGSCVVCINNSSCGTCKSCAADQMSCTAVQNGQDAAGHFCGSDGSEVECLANYGSNEVGACTDLAKPICSNGVCEACQEGYIYSQNSLACGCPDHATCSNGTVRCQAGYFKNESGTCSSCSEGAYSAEGATSCMTCGAGTANEDHTDCECYQNATKGNDGVCYCNTNFTLSDSACVCPAGYGLVDGVCSACTEDNTISKANGRCVDCGAGTANEDHTTCECYQNATKGNDGVCYCNTNFTLSDSTCVCPAGYGLVDGVCSACTDNTISKANGQCVDCGAGTANKDHTDCSCYTNATKNTTTKLCSCNQYRMLSNNSCVCDTSHKAQGSLCCSDTTKDWSSGDSSSVSVSGENGCVYRFIIPTQLPSGSVVCPAPAFYTTCNGSWQTIGCPISVAQTHNNSTTYTGIWGWGCLTAQQTYDISVSAGTTSFSLKSAQSVTNSDACPPTCSSTYQTAIWRDGYGASNSGNSTRKIRMQLK